MGCDVVAASGSLAGEELQFQDAKGSTCLPWYGMTILMAAKGSRRPATEARERRAAGGTWRKEKKHAENMSLLPFVQTGSIQVESKLCGCQLYAVCCGAWHALGGPGLAHSLTQPSAYGAPLLGI
jgi:hypothetical protein